VNCPCTTIWCAKIASDGQEAGPRMSFRTMAASSPLKRIYTTIDCHQYNSRRRRTLNSMPCGCSVGIMHFMRLKAALRRTTISNGTRPTFCSTSCLSRSTCDRTNSIQGVPQELSTSQKFTQDPVCVVARQTGRGILTAQSGLVRVAGRKVVSATFPKFDFSVHRRRDVMDMNGHYGVFHIQPGAVWIVFRYCGGQTYFFLFLRWKDTNQTTQGCCGVWRSASTDRCCLPLHQSPTATRQRNMY
jgi:hypothetical protein